MSNKTASQRHRHVVELCVFAMLGAVMFASKIIMEALPNIHLLGMLIMAYTVAFRSKALIPIYLFVFLTGIYGGFAPWWVPYLYIWAVLWGLTMLIPPRLPRRVRLVIYPLICALHGFAFGVLYAPAQALLFGFNTEQTLAWIASGLPFDLIHGISNLVCGCLVLPFSELLMRLMRKTRG